jgi:hypothetical protein
MPLDHFPYHKPINQILPLFWESGMDCLLIELFTEEMMVFSIDTSKGIMIQCCHKVLCRPSRHTTLLLLPSIAPRCVTKNVGKVPPPVCGVIFTDILVLVLDQLDKSFTVLELSETKFLHQWPPLKSQIDEFMHLYVVQ